MGFLTSDQTGQVIPELRDRLNEVLLHQVKDIPGLRQSEGRAMVTYVLNLGHRPVTYGYPVSIRQGAHFPNSANRMVEEWW